MGRSQPGVGISLKVGLPLIPTINVVDCIKSSYGLTDLSCRLWSLNGQLYQVEHS